ncbi:MAG: hypothetical protein WC817_05255 [Patescibacteria group bacterium]|jgi:hypothetical protein
MKTQQETRDALRILGEAIETANASGKEADQDNVMTALTAISDFPGEQYTEVVGSLGSLASRCYAQDLCFAINGWASDISACIVTDPEK